MNTIHLDVLITTVKNFQSLFCVFCPTQLSEEGRGGGGEGEWKGKGKGSVEVGKLGVGWGRRSRGVGRGRRWYNCSSTVNCSV